MQTEDLSSFFPMNELFYEPDGTWGNCGCRHSVVVSRESLNEPGDFLKQNRALKVSFVPASEMAR